MKKLSSLLVFLGCLFAQTPVQATNWIYDNTTSYGAISGTVFPKSDLTPIPSGQGVYYVAATDWNRVTEAIVDIRTAWIGARWYGFGEQSSDPAPSGMGGIGQSGYIWVKTADHGLHLHVNGADTSIVSQAYSTVQNNGSSLTQRTTINVLPRLTAADSGGLTTLDMTSGIVTTGSYPYVTVDTYGRVTAGSTTAQHGNGTVGAPSVTYASDTADGLYRIGSHNEGYSINGAKVLDLSATGLGVTGTLIVSSTASINGVIVDPSSPTTNYVLAYNGTKFVPTSIAGTGSVTGTGTSGYVTYWTGTSTLGADSTHVWDATNHRLGIGNGSPSYSLDITTTTGARILSSGTNSTDLIITNTSSSGHIWDIASTGSAHGLGAGRLVIYDGTANATRITLDTSGNMYLGGTTSGGTNPVSRLDVNGGISAGTYAGTTAAPSNGAIISGTVGIGTSAPTAKLSVSGSGWFTGDNTPFTNGGAGVAIVYASNIGYVYAYDYTNSVTKTLSIHPFGGNSNLGLDATTTFTLNSNLTMGASAVITARAGTSSAPAITTSGDVDTGAYFPAANQWAGTAGTIGTFLVDGTNPNSDGIGYFNPATDRGSRSGTHPGPNTNAPAKVWLSGAYQTNNLVGADATSGSTFKNSGVFNFYYSYWTSSIQYQRSVQFATLVNSASATDWTFQLANSAGSTTPWSLAGATDAITTTGQQLGKAGTSVSPTWSFSAETGMGMYRSASGVMAFVSGGTNLLKMTLSDLSLNPGSHNTGSLGNGSTFWAGIYGTQFTGLGGSAGSPTYTFSGDATGIYLSASHVMSVAVNTDDVLDISRTAAGSVLLHAPTQFKANADDGTGSLRIDNSSGSVLSFSGTYLQVAGVYQVLVADGTQALKIDVPASNGETSMILNYKTGGVQTQARVSITTLVTGEKVLTVP